MGKVFKMGAMVLLTCETRLDAHTRSRNSEPSDTAQETAAE